MLEIWIWPYYQKVYAPTRICPRNSLWFCDTKYYKMLSRRPNLMLIDEGKDLFVLWILPFRLSADDIEESEKILVAYWPMTARCANCVNNVIAGCTCINNCKISASRHVFERKCLGVVKWYIQMPNWDTGSLVEVSRQSWVWESQSGRKKTSPTPGVDQLSVSRRERRRKSVKITQCC